MNISLYNKCLDANFEAVFKNKNYSYFKKGYYNLNIIGVRANKNNIVTNEFDDILVVLYRTENNNIHKKLYAITTEPGLYYMTNKIPSNAGTAILVPGQYRSCWALGKHKGKYKALVQVKPVKVYRDYNKDSIYDMNPETIQEGVYGINIHRSSDIISPSKVDKWSAGCQVFKNKIDFSSFLYLCDKQAERYGNSFTYTLINENDLV
ncbi:MAG: hypothetical protein J6Y28_09615 [Acholeplasmatales bacterium]|nr:hypothetical protein [Methanobrevibacter sp.]MBP5446415.1 hypothetical protein [Acholeplasmatales bacterium]